MTTKITDRKTSRFGRLLHLAGALMAIVCCVATYEIVCAPLKREITSHNVEIIRLSELLKNAPVARRQHQNISERLKLVEQRIEAVQRKVPKHPEEAKFLKQLGQIADEFSVDINQFQPGKTESRTGYAQLEIALSAESDFKGLCAFFDSLARAGRLSKIKNLEIDSNSERLLTDDQERKYPINATVVIYFGLGGTSAREVGRG